MQVSIPPDIASALPPELFRELVEQAPLAIAITDKNARILYVNPAFTRTTGYVASEVLGGNPSVLSYKVTPRSVYDGLWLNISNGQAWQGELVNRRKDGSRYLCELSITPILDDAGAVRYFLGIHRDVTELHELNERLQNQKRLIESIIDLAPVAVALLDENERVLLDNHEYKKLMGSFGKQEPAYAILSGLRAELGESAWTQALVRNEFVDQTLRFDRAGGQGPQWFSASGAWFMQSEPSADTFFAAAPKRYLLLVLTDVTALKRQQQEQWLNALRMMLAEGELVARLRETLAGAAYQLAGPLNLMAAAEKRVAQRIPAGDAALMAMGEARLHGEAALALLQGAMPSIQPEAWLPLNCNELLHDVLDLSTDRLLAEGVVVDWQPALRLPAVNGQAVALRGALNQLLANALDALHDSRRSLRELRLATRQEGDWVELEMIDSGPGIPEALRLKVFEPFFTTRPGGARAGMGLALAQEVVLRHGGGLEIATACPFGCRVVVRLPVAQGEVAHG